MKVVLLAGGFGTRMAEDNHPKPKPMVEIGGMPIIWHNQAGGHVSAGDRGWEGKGWRVTEPMGSRVPGSRSLGGPNWFFVLWGCCLEGVLSGGAVPQALPLPLS